MSSKHDADLGRQNVRDSDETTWQPTLFAAVIAVEAMSILALWVFGRYFGS